jgi:hypothetical protein
MKWTRAVSLRTVGLGWAMALVLLAGCESKQDKAIDSAKAQAAATGQPQQVISVDSNGTTTTTTVQPAPTGQAGVTVTNTTAPTQTTPGTPPPQPGVYYQPAGTAQAAQTTNTQGSPQAVPGPAPAPVEEQAPVAVADVRVPAGTELAIEINQRISSDTTPPGSRFSGELAEGCRDSAGRMVLPRGTAVEGRVVASHNGGHFKGASVLELRLTSLTLNGTRYPLDTHDVVREKKGKGKRSAAFIGGGSGLGLLLGGLAGGGKGALIGGLAGAGAGTAGAGLTDNRPLDIPAETVVRFRLADALTLQG